MYSAAVRLRVWFSLSVAAIACGGPTRVTPTDPNITAGAASAVVTMAGDLCARVSACTDSHDPAWLRTPSECVEHWLSEAPAFKAVWPCLTTAPTCDAIHACIAPLGDPRAAEYCRVHNDKPSACERNVLYVCADEENEVISIDCVSLEASCTEVHLEGGLVTHGCVAPKLCPAGAPVARCVNDKTVVRCENGAAEREVCLGDTRCVEFREEADEVFAMCEPPNHAHCDRVHQSYCEGTSLVLCEPHGPTGAKRTIPCASFGLLCTAHGSQALCTPPNASACTARAGRSFTAPWVSKCASRVRASECADAIRMHMVSRPRVHPQAKASDIRDGVEVFRSRNPIIFSGEWTTDESKRLSRGKRVQAEDSINRSTYTGGVNSKN